MARGKLTPKQIRFVEEYLIDLNATGAARRAGYSERTADVQASRLLGNVKVQAAISTKQAKRSANTEITAERVLRELARLSFTDPRKLYKPDGSLIPIRDLDDDSAATIASVEVFEEYEGTGECRRLVGHTKKLKRWDKVASLDKLGRHLGLWKDGEFPGQIVVTVIGGVDLSAIVGQRPGLPFQERTSHAGNGQPVTTNGQ